MKRLIDANALKKALSTYKGANAVGHSIIKLLKIYAIIDETTTVDAVEVVHGRWEFDCACEPYCSVCGEFALQLGFDKHKSNYCPNCGADMRERKEGE